MKLFKNEVGRPSNEVIKKRKIVKVSIVASIIALITIIVGGVTLLLGKNNVNDLKGAVSSDFKDNISVDVKFDGKAQKIKEDNFDNERAEAYIVNKLDSMAVTVTIKNNNKFGTYFRIENDGKSFKSGYIEPGESNNYEIYLNINSGVCDGASDQCYRLSEIRGYFSDSSENPDGSNSFFTYFLDIYYDENMLWLSSANLVNEKGNSVGGGHVVYYDDKYEDSPTLIYFGEEKVYANVTVQNASSKRYYYRYFSYDNETISKETNNHSSGCTTLVPNDKRVLNTPIILNEKKYVGTWVMKVYNSNSSCNADEYGVSDKNVLRTSTVSWLGRTSPTVDESDKTFKIEYDSNGGNGNMYWQFVEYGKSTKLEKNRLTKEGYKFIGWHAKRTVNNKTLYRGCTTSGTCSNSNAKWLSEKQIKSYFVYNDKEEVSKTAPKGETVTMIAQWKKSNGVTKKTTIKIPTITKTTTSNKPASSKNNSISRITNFFKSIFNLFR